MQVLGLVRREVHLRAPRPGLDLRADDILILEAEPEGLSNALATLGIRLEADVQTEPEAPAAEAKSPDPAAKTADEPAGRRSRAKPATATWR